jgi:hypothetical protein
MLNAKEFIGEWLVKNTGIKGEAKDAYWSLHYLFDGSVAERYISKIMDAYVEYANGQKVKSKKIRSIIRKAKQNDR